MKLTRLFILLILTVCFFRENLAQSSPSEKQRIERLGGLAKIWGAVKYFHPYPAYRDIDLDKALIETIPQVNTAKSPQEYNAAINHLLSTLNDKETFAQMAGTEKLQTEANNHEFFRVTDGVLIIDAIGIAEAGAVDQSAVSRIFPQITASLAGTKAVIFDCRSYDALKDSGAVFEYFFDGILRAILTQISDKPVYLGSSRYRMHNDYAQQTGITSGGYYSGFIQTPAQSLIGQSKSPMLPTVVIYNEKTPAGSTIFTALQATENVLTVEAGAATPVIGGSSTVLKLPEGVSVRMRTTENINADGTVGFMPDISVQKRSGSEDAALDEALKNIGAKTLTRPKNKSAQPTATLLYGKDATYPEMKYPSAGYRLLALFRFWNVINYFYPYKDLIGDSWQTILPRFIPKLEAAKDAAEYQLTLREMAAEIHDSHGTVRNASAADEKIGLYFPPVVVRYIENQTVVAKVLEDNLPVKVGDVILAVDGEPVEKRREYLSRFFAASTPQALMRSIHVSLLRAQKGTTVKLKIRSVNGKVSDIEIVRSLTSNNPKFAAAYSRAGDSGRILPEGFGYVVLQRLTVPEVEKVFETLKSTPAIIFDMRGYPQGTAWEIAPRLTEKKNVVAALFSRPILEAANFSEDENLIAPNYTFEQKLPAPKGDVYKGKVVVLIDESAISQAEHLCLFLAAARPDVTFIGMPTTGANGDVTSVILPGNISINFTGQSVRHADGRQLQRIGIQPTVKAEPTIRGIIANQDEILDAAVKFLKAKK